MPKKIIKFDLIIFRSLKIGFIHNLLSERSIVELDLHLEAGERLLNKINQILNDHVLHDASNTVSKHEFEELLNNKACLESIREEIKNIPNIAAPYLESIEDFQLSMLKIIEYIDKTTAMLQESQLESIKNTSTVMDCL